MNFIIDHLSKSFETKKVLRDINFTFESGKIYGLLGRNGAGKTTLFNCLNKDMKADGGSFYLEEGASCRDVVPDDIGYVLSTPTVPEFLTGREFLKFFLDIHEGAIENPMPLDAYFDFMSIEPEDRDKLMKTYSHGMKQKLNIIGALIHEPKIWILDEPMTGLDPKSSYNLKKLMKEHAAKGNCVFFSSHVLDVVEKVCDRVGIIDDGKLVADCTLNELKSQGLDESLEELFLKLTEDEPEEREEENAAK